MVFTSLVGNGLFSSNFLNKNEYIAEYKGSLYKESDTSSAGSYAYSFLHDKEYCMVVSKHGSPAIG